MVVKQQLIRLPAANLMEWFIWNAVEQSAIRDHFGQCVSISETGKYLMMERLTDILRSDWPKVPSVPDWLNDRKPSAFGKDKDGRIKVRDFGLVDLNRALDLRTFRVPWANDNA